MFGISTLGIHSHVVVIVDDEGGQHREVEQPPFAEHPVVAVAATDAEECALTCSRRLWEKASLGIVRRAVATIQ